MTIKTERLLSRAKKLYTKGNFSEAESIYLEVLKLAPNNKDAKNAISALKNKKNIVPIPQSELQSAVFLVNNGKIQEALQVVEPLIDKYPDESILFNIRGVCNKANNQFNDAIDDFNHAVSIKPDYAEAYYNLGVTLREIGNPNAAIIVYQKALSINHHYVNAHNNLGQIFLVKEDFNAAIEHLEWAVAFNPEFSSAHNNLGSSFLGLNKIHDAIQSFNRALELNPNYAIPYYNLGVCYQRIGEIKLAKENFENALALNADYAKAHHNLSSVKTYKSRDSQVIQMEELLSKKDLNHQDRVILCFALAKVNEDLENSEKLFTYLHDANKLRRDQINYSIEKSENHNIITKKFFTQKSVKIQNEFHYENSSIRPIFIVGMLRSGTSLIEQILSTHHQVYGGGELKNLTNIIIPIMQEHLNNEKHSLSHNEFSTIRKQYLESLSKFNVSETVITDKWPLNFRNIGFILSALPEAKIVHVKRDPIATCWSIYKHYFSAQGNGWAYSFDDLSTFYGFYVDLMSYWHKLYPGKIYDLSYEELTVNQEKETRKLLDYCDLDWDEKCLNFQDNKRDVNTASVLQVRKKMYQGSSDAWKKYEEYLKPLVKSLKDH
tara:strand:- start:242 stop:2059 length:1818 start_codon:yes stop_codon:yes gene_type:complete